MLQTIVSFVIVLGLLVFVHELGHFLFAKRAGILVREFAIGFGPKIFSRKKGETLYSVRLLPLGGYVRMAGEDPEVLEVKTGSLVYATKTEQGEIDHLYFYEPMDLNRDLFVGRVVEIDWEKDLFVRLEMEEGKEERFSLHREAILHVDEVTEMQIAPIDRQFASKTPGQKALTIFAGPLFNLILTVILFIIYTAMTGVEYRLPISEVVPNSAAQKAGIKPGDEILAVAGKRINTYDMLRYELMETKGREVMITVKRGNQTLELPITPQKSGEAYVIGAVFEQSKMLRDATFLESLQGGFQATYNWTVVLLDGFRDLVTGQVSIKSLGGPVQIGEVTGQVAEAGILPLIRWTALLSLNLAIFNLLPIPALDGSRLVFIGLEALRGKPINPNKESMVHLIGFALLMVLMLVVTYNDIVKVFFT